MGLLPLLFAKSLTQIFPHFLNIDIDKHLTLRYNIFALLLLETGYIISPLSCLFLLVARKNTLCAAGCFF